NEPAKCSCLLNLGNTNAQLPASVVISQASINVTDSLTGELRGYEDEFEFEDDSELAAEIQNQLPVGSQSYGFAVDVNAVSSLPLGAADVHELLFKMEVAPEDLAALETMPISFAAGSDMAGHPLQVLDGYKSILTFPPPKGVYTWDGRGDGDWVEPRWGLGNYYPLEDAKASINTDLVTVSGSQLADKTTVTSGNLQVLGSLQTELQVDAGGMLSGDGLVVGEVAVEGIVSPSGGLAINGDIEISQKAQLRIVMGSNEPPSELSVSGKATLEGVLSLIDNDDLLHEATRGEQLSVAALQAGRLSGAFTRIQLNGNTLAADFATVSGFRSHLGDGVFYTVEQNNRGYQVTRLFALEGDADGDGVFDSGDLIRVF
ncbi:MAG: hypothetical protein KDB23_32875, partial [Planctomycetales bacterium]|nr:hypothetical protein [Planctomycetales bacterium]